MEKFFSHILNEDEAIVKVERENMASGVIQAFLASIPTGLFVGSILAMFVPTVLLNNDTAFVFDTKIFLFAFIFIVVLILIAGFLQSKMYYICLTNKRVIVRTGVFTTNFKSYSIEKVTGNITTMCKQLIFDKTDASSCAIKAKIELMPVGHGDINLSTHAITNGYTFAKELERVVKENALNQK